MFRSALECLCVFSLIFPTILSGCGDNGSATPTVDLVEEWIGAWQYMREKEGVLVSDGNRKILFTPEGTWQLSHDDETGTYIVFEGRFHIDPSGSKNKTGSWTRDGNILKLAYDDTTIRILQKTDTFQKYTPPPPPPPPPPPENLGLTLDVEGYESWRAVELPPPPAEFEVPQDSGSAHGLGTRTVYINATGVETLEDAREQTFHSGTTIVKEIKDDRNTFVWRVAVMWKVGDAMYADHNYWKYIQYQRDSADDAFIGVAGDVNGHRGNGCHACHSKANDAAVPGKDSVFTQLP